MDVDRHINKQILLYSAMTFIGGIAWFLGSFMKIQTHSMTGIALGFIPAGLGSLLIVMYARKKPALRKNFVGECDERSVYIRSKSGATAFWITFWWIFCLTIFSNWFAMSVNQLGVSTLIFMGVVYFSILFVNHSEH